MTCKIPITLYGDYIVSSWFLNSAHALYGDELHSYAAWSESDGFHRVYEETYGVTIRFDMFGWIEYAEFVDNLTAIEFMLRWS